MRTPVGAVRMGIATALLAASVSACVTTHPDPRLRDVSAWVREDARGRFSFLLPPSLVRQDVTGIDSYVGQYRGEAVFLEFDYGSWSNSLRDDGERRYTSRPVVVGGRAGRLVRFRLPRNYVGYAEGMRHFAGLHVPTVVPARREGGITYGSDTALTLMAMCRTEADCDAMEAVLLSVEFPE